MSVPVLLSITIGLPIIMLALGVFYHGYVIARQSFIDPLDAHVAGLATGQAGIMVGELQGAMDQIRDQLTQQREALSTMLSDADRAQGARRATASAGLDFAARAASPRVSGAPRAAAARVEPRTDPAADLYGSVARLAAEGLSDRAIARQLHVGLEEVRMTRARTGNAS
ncbi:MAG: hypothetical protein WEB13_07160 [Dehalococcoidia bacterium]